MNKGELVAKIAESRGITKVQAEQALNIVLRNMAEAMERGERVTLVGFGSFKVVERATQKGRNPQTGESITIPAHNVVKFKPGKRLCAKVQMSASVRTPDSKVFRKEQSLIESSSVVG